ELARRLAGLIALRLVLLTLVLVILTTSYLSGPGGFSGVLALGSVAVSYAIAAVFGAALRAGRNLRSVAYAHVVIDPLLWSVIVYVSGGAASAAITLYGLTCLSGASVLGRRGAWLGGAVGVTLLVAIQVGLWTGTLPVPPDQSAGLYDMTPRAG